MDKIKKNFGFGCMRLPMKNGEIDTEETCRMVDAFLDAGFNYFDTAHGYLQGRSETALKTCLTSRYPRDRYILTNKLTANFFKTEADIRPLFENSLKPAELTISTSTSCTHRERETIPTSRLATRMRQLLRSRQKERFAMSVYLSMTALRCLSRYLPNIPTLRSYRYSSTTPTITTMSYTPLRDARLPTVSNAASVKRYVRSICRYANCSRT